MKGITIGNCSESNRVLYDHDWKYVADYDDLLLAELIWDHQGGA